MAEHFKFLGDYGDQDFYVLFSWYYTDKFYMLPCNFNYQANIILGESLHPEIERRENAIKELTAADEISENDVDGDEWEDIYMSGRHMVEEPISLSFAFRPRSNIGTDKSAA